MDTYDILLPSHCSQGVITRPLVDFVLLCDSSPSLQECDVLNMDRYFYRVHGAVPHRFLLLQLCIVEPHKFYVRLERRGLLNPSPTKYLLFKPHPARDEVRLR
jgi:hypothetical protein